MFANFEPPPPPPPPVGVGAGRAGTSGFLSRLRKGLLAMAPVRSADVVPVPPAAGALSWYGLLYSAPSTNGELDCTVSVSRPVGVAPLPNSCDVRASGDVIVGLVGEPISRLLQPLSALSDDEFPLMSVASVSGMARGGRAGLLAGFGGGLLPPFPGFFGGRAGGAPDAGSPPSLRRRLLSSSSANGFAPASSLVARRCLVNPLFEAVGDDAAMAISELPSPKK